MRCLAKNKKVLYYALYSGKTELVDGDGNSTGEYVITHGTPMVMKANVSPATGNYDLNLYGINGQYSHVIVTDDMSCLIDTNSVIWLDKEPVVNSVVTPYNYVVVRVSKSLTNIAIAIQEVKL